MSKLAVFLTGWGSPIGGREFAKLSYHYKKDGYDTITVAQVNLTGMEDSTNKVLELLALTANCYTHTILIGHSYGGLVARNLFQICPYKKNLSAIITIATPHQGTPYAYCHSWWSPSAKEMIPSSKFLIELNSSIENIPCLSLSAGLDIIVPRYSSKYGENVTIPWVGHASILLSFRTYYEQWAWLNETLYPDEFNTISTADSMSTTLS